MNITSIANKVASKLAGTHYVGQRVRNRKWTDQVGTITEIYREGRAATVLFDGTSRSRGFYLWALEPIYDDA